MIAAGFWKVTILLKVILMLWKNHLVHIVAYLEQCFGLSFPQKGRLQLHWGHEWQRVGGTPLVCGRAPAAASLALQRKKKYKVEKFKEQIIKEK